MQQYIYFKMFLNYWSFHTILICTWDVTLSNTQFPLALKLKPETACCTLNLDPAEFRKLAINRVLSCCHHIMHHTI